MNKKLLFSGILVLLLVFSFCLIGCDNGSTSGGNGYVFTLHGITNIQLGQASNGFIFGLFTPGASDADVKAAVAAFFASSAPPSSLKAYIPSNSPPSGGSSDNWSISSDLIDMATGQQNFATNGIYDAWFVLKSGTSYKGYKSASYAVSGDVTESATSFSNLLNW
jgi:hypothetical protein